MAACSLKSRTAKLVYSSCAALTSLFEQQKQLFVFVTSSATNEVASLQIFGRAVRQVLLDALHRNGV